MTRKHYIAIARIIKDARASGARLATQAEFDAVEDARKEIAQDLARYLSSTNDRFDRGRFLDACGLTYGVGEK